MAAPDGEDVQRLEPDNAELDALSHSGAATHDEGESITSQSIASSIFAYKYENGRRYHAFQEGAYWLPNDETEQSRLDLLHHLYKLAIDGELYLAPLKDMKRCLDVGTGTGIWATDLAEDFPKTEIIGTDLSPIQPSWVPANVKFYIEDAEAEWSHSEAFDMIHVRNMGSHIKDWPRLLNQALKSLEPGVGWCELHEFEGHVLSRSDPELNNCPNLKNWVELINQASAKFGSDFNAGPKIKGYMIDAGFVDVQEKTVQVPLSPWAKGQKAKDMGMVQQIQFCDAIDSYTIALFTRVLGWSNEECKVIMERAKKEIRDPRHQLFVNLIYVYGRRPE